MNKIKELKQERAKLVAEMRTALDKAQAEKRSLNTEEKSEDEKRWARVEELNSIIEREERQQEVERNLAAMPSDDPATERREKASQPPKSFRATPEYEETFGRFLRGGPGTLTESEVRRIQTEYRALQADIDVSGGYMVAPQQFVDQLIKFVDNAVFMRGLATKYTVTSAASMGAPSLDTDQDDSDWTVELGSGSEEGSMAFGKRELNPHPLAKYIKVSNKLLRQSGQVENLVRDRLGYKNAVAQEKAFLTGTGSNQPLGVFTASSQGISTGRDVSTDNTSTAITADGLINALYSLKGQYQRTARWIFHRDAIKAIRKLKDGNGQYLWNPGITGGQPSSILDRPYDMSEYAPNTFTTGLYVGIVGDFSNYWIVDALSPTIQRLVELYAVTNQTGFIIRSEVDGMPVLEEAFARVKLA